jgi:hypothetical protein
MLNRIDVVNAYRFILGREPENDDAIEKHIKQCSNIAELRNVFFASQEFKLIISDSDLPPTQSNSGQSLTQDYSGILPEDFLLLRRYLVHNKISESGYLTDFMGVKHFVEDLPHIKERSGWAVNSIPVPDDSFHAEAIEYVGVLMAVEEAVDVFTMFEFGAGWGPWMATAGVACRMRGGFETVNLIGVEGEANKIPYIQRHLIKNELMPQGAVLKGSIDNINTTIYQGVVNAEDKPVKLPLVSGEHYGASLIEDTILYRTSALTEVPGYSPSFLFKDYNLVDLVHVDIQGYEGVLFFDDDAVSAFRQKVKYICIGTHSRKIEGCLFEHLYNNGFQLLREKPCRVTLPASSPESFIDITYGDGTQVWRNLLL